jgi:hypothetical protein
MNRLKDKTTGGNAAGYPVFFVAAVSGLFTGVNLI